MPRLPRCPGRAPVLAGAVIAILAGIVLTATRGEMRPPVLPRVAIRIALSDPATSRALAGSGWNHVSANPLDDQLERVELLDRRADRRPGRRERP